MRVTVFSSYGSKHPNFINVDYVLEGIKNCDIQDQIYQIRNCQDIKMRRYLKEQLPCILFAGEFYRREDKAFNKAAGFCILDIDHIAGNVEDEKKRFSQYPFVYSAFVSPSGDGLKVLVRIPATTDKHRSYYRGLMKMFPELDGTSINESRICFSSCDPNIYINKNAIEFTDLVDFVKPVSIGISKECKNTNYFKLANVAKIIREAEDGGKHIAILKAGRLLGG